MRARVGEVFFPSKSTACTVSAGSQKEQAACHHCCLPAHGGPVPARLFFFDYQTQVWKVPKRTCEICWPSLRKWVRWSNLIGKFLLIKQALAKPKSYPLPLKYSHLKRAACKPSASLVCIFFSECKSNTDY